MHTHFLIEEVELAQLETREVVIDYVMILLHDKG